jgi:prevent-host-death family protein
MKTLDASEAMAQLDILLAEVEQGESVVITREGKPIARLIPDQDERQREIDRAIAEIKEARKTAPRVTVEEILAWRDEGRK